MVIVGKRSYMVAAMLGLLSLAMIAGLVPEEISKPMTTALLGAGIAALKAAK